MHTRLKHFGFSLLATLALTAGVARAQTYTSTGTISIPFLGTAQPYPSTIVVSNGPASINNVSVRLSGFTHSYPDDLDIMLVAPGGQRIMLMSDVGGASPVANLELAFVDGADAVPQTGLSSGIYSCTNSAASVDSFPSPAPSASGAATSFSSLINTSANGTWQLFVVDDLSGDAGFITSWSLEFNAAAAALSQPVDTAFTYQGRLDNAGSPVNGPIDVRYQFWTSAEGVSPSNIVSPLLAANNVQAVNGAFSVDIAMPGIAQHASALYLDIAVRVPSGVGAFVPLTPRQRIAPTPQSSFAVAASALSATDGSPARAVIVDRFGRVGVGSGAPQSTLHVEVGSDAALATTPNAYLTLGPTNAANVAFDSNEILARNNGAPSTLFLNANGGAPVVIGTNVARLGVGAVIRGGLLLDTGAPEDAIGISFGTFSNQIGGSVENTDPVGIFRYNPAPDVSFLRFCAGDLPSAQDGFQFGIRDDTGAFLPQFVFLSSGAALKPGGGMWSVLSDPRAKHDIMPLTNTLDRLLNLRGYSYEYNTDMVEQGIALPGRQIGLMADEVERIFPDWITRDDKGTRFVTERSTTALMVEALRDLRTEKDRELAAKQAEIENLKARLDRLEAALIAK